MKQGTPIPQTVSPTAQNKKLFRAVGLTGTRGEERRRKESAARSPSAYVLPAVTTRVLRQEYRNEQSLQTRRAVAHVVPFYRRPRRLRPEHERPSPVIRTWTPETSA